MAAGVLFDAPGPKTVARHRIYTVVATVLLLLAVSYVIKRLNDAGQFAYALWEPFFTPRIVQAIGDAWLDTLSMAVLAVLGALVFGVVFGVGDRSGLLRAAATFLWGGVFGGGGSCALLALFGSGLFCLVVVFVGGLGLSGTTTFLASGLLRLGFVVAVLNVVSRLKWRRMSEKKDKD